MAAREPKLKIMISSSVYGKEPLIEQISAALSGFGYIVWNSHMGTLPIMLGSSTYQSCLNAVDQCDVFLCLITPRYGSGTDGVGGKSITHLELERAIEKNKPRFFLAHEQVINARRLLSDLSLKGSARTADGEASLPNISFKGLAGRSELLLRKGAEIIDDLRLIDMYEAATVEDLPIVERQNNWVQKYQSDQDVHRFIEAQFSGHRDMRRLIENSKSENGA